jgi:hypothetical protein
MRAMACVEFSWGVIHSFRLSLRERIVVLMAIDRNNKEVSYGI